MGKNFGLVKRPPKAREIYRVHRKSVADSHLKIVRVAAKNRAGVTETWDHKHKFVAEVKRPIGHVIATVKVVAEAAEQASVTVWHLLSEGTKVRRVALSPGYKRATTPGSFFSRKKQGYAIVDGVSREGIEARDWDKIQNEETLKEMKYATPAAVRAAGRLL